MKYIFFGTPKFAAIILDKLIEAGFIPAALICNPDEPVGRKKILTAPPTKMIAQANNIPVWQPEKLSAKGLPGQGGSASGGEIIDKLGGVDLVIVAAYNKIIPKSILDSLPAKFIGVHPSMLPKYRGPSPIQTAILNSDKETGVDLFLIDKGIDHGPVLASINCEILQNDNYETLEKKLAELGAKLLIENIPTYLAGKIKPIEQDHEKATFTKKFLTEDGKVNLENDSPELIFNKIRSLNPDPGVFTFIETKNGEKRVKLLEAKLNDGKLELLKVQPEGKKPMNYKDFLNGLKNSNY